jgi:hypothetical protein
MRENQVGLQRDEFLGETATPPALEKALAREFRRRVRGEEQPLIQDDMLAC